MRLFLYENYNLKLNDPELLLVKEFEAIWKKDRTKDKKKAFEYFRYIYLLEDWSSPFFEYTVANKIKAAKESCNGLTDKDFMSDEIITGLKKYTEIRDSNRILRYAKSQWILLDKIEEYIDGVDFTETIEAGPQKGKLVHSVKEARDTVRQMPDLIQKAKEVRDLVKEEMKQEDENRRGGTQAPLDKY